MQLRDYQKAGVEFLRERDYALLADDVGIGKTAQALCASDDFPALIICPASVKHNWQNQIGLWKCGNGHHRIIASHIINGSQGDIPKNCHYYIVNYDLISRKESVVFKKLMAIKFKLIVCDEAHKLKNTRARRTRRILDQRGLISRTVKMWFLTGTPIKNRPIDLYSLLSSTRPDLIKPYNSYLRFAYRFCGAYEDKYGLNVNGASHERDLANRIRPFMLRREQEEVLSELPAAMLDTVELDCTEEVKQLIHEEELKTVEMAGDRDPELFTLGETARIRQVLAKYKIKECLPFIKDLLEETPKIVLFYHHKSVRDALLKSLSKEGPVYIDGSVPAPKRHGIVEKFNTDPACRVFLGQIQACGEGLDGLQHNCHTAVFIEPSWSPTDITQCIGRLKRLGQQYMVNAYILVIKSTLEAKMMGTAHWKESVMNKIIQKTGEKTMSLEQEVATLNKQLGALINLFTKALDQANDPAPAASPSSPGKAGTKGKGGKGKGGKGKGAAAPAPDPEPQPEDPADDVSLDQVRALASDICKKFPNGVGKERCKTIIQALGGTKLDTLKGAALGKCYEQFQAVLAEEAEDDGI